MRITNNEVKPSIDEALEHYGIKGMKWGVRRSDEELARERGGKSAQARQAVRDVGGTPAQGLGKKSAWNGMRSSRDIKKARQEVDKINQKLMDAEDRMDAAKTPSEKAKAKKDFDAAEREYDTSHQVAVAAQLRSGEAAAIWAVGSLATGNPITGFAVAIGANAAAQANSQRVMNRRNNILEAERMKGKTYKKVGEESAAFINKAASDKVTTDLIRDLSKTTSDAEYAKVYESHRKKNPDLFDD